MQTMLRRPLALLLLLGGASGLDARTAKPLISLDARTAKPLISRRHAFAAAASCVAAPLAAGAASPFDGEYSDPNHPDGFRRITTVGSAATIVGQDDPGSATWRIAGRVDEGTIALKVEQGSVQPPEGTTLEDFAGDGTIVPVFRGKLAPGGRGIAWPDGNTWSLK